MGRAGSDAVIRRFVEEVQNGKSEAVYDELNDPAFVNPSSPPGIPSDRGGGKTFLFGFLNASPDSRFTIDDMIAEGDQVVTNKTFTGTHTGEFTGIPATGNKVTLQFVDIMRVRNGRIALAVHGPAQLHAAARRHPDSWARREGSDVARAVALR